jgi:RNA polymerase sigma-70 factor
MAHVDWLTAAARPLDYAAAVTLRDGSHDAAVGAAWEAARAAWPDVHVAPELFARAVAERLGGGDVPSAIAGLHTSDLYLCLACASDDVPAVRALDRLLAEEMPRFLARYDPTSARCDEVRQRLHERLLVGRDKHIADYRARGSLVAWLRVAALREAIALGRGKANVLAHDDEAARLLALADERDPELELIRRRYASHFRRALVAALDSLSAEQRELLLRYFVDARTLEEIARLAGVNRSTVLRRLRVARDAVLLAARARLADELGLSDSQFDTVGRVLQADLDLSLSRHLRGG